MTAVKIIHHLMLLLALFEQSLLLQSLTWVMLWLEEEWGKLALLIALFEQRLLLQSLTWVILWVVLGKKPMAIAAGAKLVPTNTPIAIALIAIRLICLIIVGYCVLLYKKSNVVSHLWYLSSTLYKTTIICLSTMLKDTNSISIGTVGVAAGIYCLYLVD